MVINSFSFLILTYNHEKYIVEHLESIKYLILNYGSDIEVDLLINDDYSKDSTVVLVDKWINSNKSLFREVKKVYNKKNLGTAASVINLLNLINSDLFKMTAGDDVYSFENIFSAANFSDDYAFHSGFPLYFKNSKPYLNLLSSYLHLATQNIYSNQNLLERFTRFNYHNAPNIFYNLKYILNKEVLTYLSKYDVVEDWPLQIAISRKYQNLKFKYSPNVYVYYRRTPGSIFLIENDRFSKDKLMIYNDLILNSNFYLNRNILKLRVFCFKNRRFPFFRILNVDIWIFLIKSIPYLFHIISFRYKNKFGLDKHYQHLNLIQIRATCFLDDFNEKV